MASELLGSTIRRFSGSNYTGNALQQWRSLQKEMAEEVRLRDPAHLRVLVVSPVRDDPRAVQTFVENRDALTATNEGFDTFDFALFHHEGTNAHWVDWPWYDDTSIVLKRAGYGCKPHFWAEVTPDLASKYDYIWLMDGDLRLDFFSWDLYRAYLLKLDPLVSQPSVLPRSLGERASDHEDLNMYQDEHTPFPMALEVNRTEIMAPVLSTRIWNAVHSRLRSIDLHSDWYLSDFWDAVALASTRNDCGGTGLLLVNAAPIRHMNCHDLFKGPSHCTKGCGNSDLNCRPASLTQVHLAAKSLHNGTCTYRKLRRTLLSDNCTYGAGSYTTLEGEYSRHPDMVLSPSGRLLVERMTVHEAFHRCSKLVGCVGFTQSLRVWRSSQSSTANASNSSTVSSEQEPEDAPNKFKTFFSSSRDITRDAAMQVNQRGAWVTYKREGKLRDMRYCQQTLAAQGPHRVWLRNGTVVHEASLGLATAVPARM